MKTSTDGWVNSYGERVVTQETTFPNGWGLLASQVVGKSSAMGGTYGHKSGDTWQIALVRVAHDGSTTIVPDTHRAWVPWEQVRALRGIVAQLAFGDDVPDLSGFGGPA